LATARVIEPEAANHPAGLVVVGSTVVIQEQGFDAETYTIVGAAEANPREGKISNESPIGKAILNREVGETVTVETPSGMYKVKIIKVSRASALRPLWAQGLGVLAEARSAAAGAGYRKEAARACAPDGEAGGAGLFANR
jgi:hypothetical protein